MPRSSATTIPAVRKSVNGNLLYNGDFEYLPASNTPMTSVGDRFITGTATGSTTDNTYQWYVYNYAGTRSAQFDTTTSYSGSGSLKLTTNAGSIGVSLGPFTAGEAFYKNALPVEPNTVYNISIWVKTNYISGDATTGCKVTVQGRTVYGTAAGAVTSILTGLKTTQNWTQYTSTITTSSTARYLLPNLQVAGNDGTATLNMEAWFDNVSITKTTPDIRSTSTTPRRSVENLVFNGDFEYAPAFTAATNAIGAYIDGTASGSASNNNLYGWSTIAGFNSNVNKTCRFDTSTYHSGTSSMLLSLDNTIADIQVWSGGRATSRTQAEAFAVRVLPNTSYTVSGWIKVDKSAGTLSDGAWIIGSERDGSGVNTVENSTTKLATTTDWTFVTSTFTTGSTTRFIAIKLRIQTTTTATVNAWFDDIRLTKTTPDTRSAA